MERERPGEVKLEQGALERSEGDRVVFIGRIRSQWMDRSQTPKNLRQARERGPHEASVEVDEPFRPGLADLAGASHVILLTWMHRAERDVIRQLPRHAERPLGLFSLRSPARPNPIGLEIVRLLDLDEDRGLLTVDATDCLDGTPLVDIKPYLPSIDAFPEAVPPRR
ncbi:tRNA (N6-threonylcarbamoyladenosine(37)-N6)-methyltransferase TrmO [Lutibaculum baratangense]|uniref:TsaA-like domain-containing protein n=1 Tax=Lutibaculum baratangense AMV1 TaxID=631454 RepID=V4QXP4_9HYPH|nr:tRNA (N6-threonylcarbamoyladenosine(37)-N6)-methyltransferase TrmO [Lutibaculum baratangense]ESR24502.1 hypothetical protein N177_2336 [Lutibaculum baratangense AMV1]